MDVPYIPNFSRDPPLGGVASEWGGCPCQLPMRGRPTRGVINIAAHLVHGVGGRRVPDSAPPPCTEACVGGSESLSTHSGGRGFLLGFVCRPLYCGHAMVGSKSL